MNGRSEGAVRQASREPIGDVGSELTALEREEITADAAPYGEIVSFLHREADLVDGYRFSDWLELFTDDVEYRMPVRTTRFLRDGEGFTETDFFVENHDSLTTRVKRLETEFAWAEAPPSRTRHFVTNVRAFETDTDGELAVRSNFMITRTRSDLEYQLFTGARHDVMRRTPDGLRIARRAILVDQTVITATNLSVLF
jgi:3-phenylpropionate/cinnamic acid dioxygenase small subunit